VVKLKLLQLVAIEIKIASVLFELLKLEFLV